MADTPKESLKAWQSPLAAPQTAEPRPALHPQQRQSSRLRLLASFILPVLILFLAFGLQEVFPFGDRQILTVDLYHQYAPFLGELRSKLLSGDSLFFTWHAGLGINFFALLAYYEASPLNLLTILFPASMLSEMVLCLVLLKVGLSGLCMYLFLRRYYRREGPLLLCFGVAYALSGYVLAFFWNMMWLDAVFLLPCVAYGMLRLVREGILSYYLFSLSLLLLANFYTGFFASFFLFFFFFLILERHGQPAARLTAFFRVAAATILGISAAAILLIPTVMALGHTSAAGNKVPEKVEFYDALIDFLSRLLPFSSPNIRSGMANIYVGSFVLFLLFSYFLSRRVRLRTKVLAGSLLVFLILSMNINMLNFLWHGLHFPNQIPFRFSFVFCFLLLFLACDGIPALRDLPRQSMLRFGAVLILLILLLEKIDGTTYSRENVFLVLLFLLGYLFLLAWLLEPAESLPLRTPRARYLHHRREELVSLLLLALIILELTANTFITITRVRNNEYFGIRTDYMAGQEPQTIRELARRYQEQGRPDLVRLELKPDYSVNDASLYQLNGFSIFASTYPEGPISYLAKLGYPNNGINSFQYVGSTPVMDSLLGIRYVIHRDPINLEDPLKKKVEEKDGITVWENPQALPVAFLADPLFRRRDGDENMLHPSFDALAFPPASQPFDYQAALFEMLSGENDVFADVRPEVGSKQEHITVKEKSANHFELSRDGEDKAFACFRHTAESDGNYYLAWKSNGLTVNGASLQKGDSDVNIGRKAQNVTELGFHKKGEEILVKIDVGGAEKRNATGTLELYMARLDEPRYQAGIKHLRSRKTAVTHYDSRTLEVQTASEDAAMLFVSTTANPGWQAWIDGTPVDLLTVQGTFLALMVPEGSHQIRLCFTPEGYKLGRDLSIIAWLMILLVLALELRDWRRRVRRPASGKASKPEQADASEKDSGRRSEKKSDAEAEEQVRGKRGELERGGKDE